MSKERALRLSVCWGLDRANIDQALTLKRRIYAEDTNWVPPIPGQFRRSLAANHPYSRRGKFDLLVVRLDDEPVASATVFFDESSATALGHRTAYFSSFESVDDIAIAEHLVRAVEEWSIEQGADHLVGPMSPRMSDPRGVLIEGGGPPVFGMSYNPDYYDPLLTRLNFEKAMDLFEFIVPCRDHYPRLEKVAALAQTRFPKLRLRPFDLNRLEQEFRVVADIYNEAWRANWGFIPLDYDDLVHTASGLRAFLGPATAMIAELDGKPIGFQMVVPDLNRAIKAVNGRLWPFGWMKVRKLIARERVFRAFFIGVLPKYRKTGVEAMLIRAGLDTGAERFHIGWVLDSNYGWKQEIAQIAEGDVGHKRYRIYQRLLGRSLTDG